MVREGGLTVDEHTVQHTNHVSLKRTLEICIVLLTNVTPINLIIKP